jgi:hypothetical protein
VRYLCGFLKKEKKKQEEEEEEETYTYLGRESAWNGAE